MLTVHFIWSNSNCNFQAKRLVAKENHSQDSLVKAHVRPSHRRFNCTPREAANIIFICKPLFLQLKGYLLHKIPEIL